MHLTHKHHTHTRCRAVPQLFITPCHHDNNWHWLFLPLTLFPHLPPPFLHPFNYHLALRGVLKLGWGVHPSLLLPLLCQRLISSISQTCASHYWGVIDGRWVWQKLASSHRSLAAYVLESVFAQGLYKCALHTNRLIKGNRGVSSREAASLVKEGSANRRINWRSVFLWAILQWYCCYKQEVS